MSGQAARILTTVATQEEETTATSGRLIHGLLLEMVRDSGSAAEVAAACGHHAGWSGAPERWSGQDR